MRLGKVLLIALALQLAAPVTSGMLVLCVGSDGHVAVEPAAASLCCREWQSGPAEPSDVHATTAMERATGQCCSDMELSVKAATQTVAPQKGSPSSPAAGGAAVLELPPRTNTLSLSFLAADSPVAVSLRTVALRA